MELVQPDVAYPHGFECGDPRLIEVPQVPRDLVRSQGNRADPRLETDAFGVVFIGVGQDQAAAEQSARHSDLEPAFRRREKDGRVFLVGETRGPAALLKGHAPLERRIARLIQQHGLVEPGQEPRIHEVVQVGRIGTENYRGLFLVHPVHRNLEGIGPFPVGTPVRRVDDVPRVGVHDVSLGGIGASRLQLGAFGHAHAVRHHEDLVLDPADALVVAAEPDHGSGFGLAGDIVFPGIEFDHPDASAHETIVELHLEVRKQHGVVDGPPEEFRQQHGLRIHVADVYPFHIVEGGIYVLADVENRGKGERGETRPEDQFRVQRDVARRKELRTLYALGGRDHVHQRVGRENPATDHLLRVTHEGPAERCEKPLFFEGVPGEEDAGIINPDLVPGAREVDPGEELHVDRFFDLLREIGGLAGMPVREVVHAAEGQDRVPGGREKVYGARRGMGGEVPGHRTRHLRSAATMPGSRRGIRPVRERWNRNRIPAQWLLPSAPGAFP